MSETGTSVAVSIPTYRDFITGFTPAAIEAQLAGRLDRGLNPCIECCDRHAEPSRVALFWEGKDGRSARVTFLELKEDSARLANLLQARGIRPGDRVAGLLPRIPELLVVILGVWRAGAVYQPLFTAFGPKAIEYRIASSGARLIFTDRDNRHKLAEVAECPPIVVVDGGADAAEAKERDFSAELARQPATFEPIPMLGDDPFLMLFTSGTTGPRQGRHGSSQGTAFVSCLHALGPRFASRGRLLEHCRSRRGLRSLLRGDRPTAAGPRDDAL